MFRKEVDNEIGLVLLEESFATELFQLIESDREFLIKWLSWVPHTKSSNDVKNFIKESLHNYAENKSMTCAIDYLGKIVGIISYNKIIKHLKKVEIGYWLSSKYNGKGIMTRACNHLIQYAFDYLQMEKVQIAVATENKPSRNVCERLGLTMEGIIRNSENLHGKIVDHAIYGIFAKSSDKQSIKEPLN